MTDPLSPPNTEALPVEAVFYDLEFTTPPFSEGEVVFGAPYPPPREYDLTFGTYLEEGNNVVFGEDPYRIGEFDLVFDSELREDNNIIFGDTPSLEGQLPEIGGALRLPVKLATVSSQVEFYKDLYRLSLKLPLASFPIRSEAFYDINTFRGFSRASRLAFREADITIRDTRGKIRDSLHVYEDFSTRYQEMSQVTSVSLAQYEDAYIIKRAAVNFFEDAQPVKTFALTTSQVAEVVSLGKVVSFQAALGISHSPVVLNFQESELVSRGFNTEASTTSSVSTRFSFSNYYARPYNKSFDIFYQNAEYPVNALPPVILPPTEPSTPDKEKEYNYDIYFSCTPTADDLDPRNGDITFNECWKTKPPSSVDYTEPYFVLNSIELINLETGEAIQATSLDFSTDLSSFAWSGSMTVSADEVSKITSPSNNAVKVSLTFNGNLAVFMVKTISKTVSFNKAAYKVELISPTALLDSPYSRIDSRTVTEDIAPQSLIEPMLQTAVTGVALHWKYLSPLDWVVAANTFTYQELSPIKAIGKLLEGSAAFMYSDLDGSGLTIQRKRQVEFWEEGLNPIVLEPALVTSLSFSQERHRNFDAVYVISGLNNTLGITAHVVRDAYAGTELAPQIIAPTLTSPSAIRDAGKYCLGTAGVVETRTLSQPIIAGSPLLLPSDLVSFEQDGTTYLGTVISTGVSLKFNSQYQNFVVEVVKGFA